MKKYKVMKNIKIIAYCFMPNHYHFFLQQLEEQPTISEFISLTFNSYTKYFNTKYQKNGTLFESKFKSKEIQNPTHFIWLIRYILKNPEKAKLVQHYSEWKFSNARDLLHLRNGNLADNKFIENIFQDKNEMLEFLENLNELEDSNILFY